MGAVRDAMDVDVFEELINDVLNGGDASARARLSAAIQANPTLATVARQWERLVEALRTAMPLPEDVPWAQFRASLAVRLQGPPSTRGQQAGPKATSQAGGNERRESGGATDGMVR